MHPDLIGTWSITGWWDQSVQSIMHVKNGTIFDIVYFDDTDSNVFLAITILKIETSSVHALVAANRPHHHFELLTRQFSPNEFMLYRMDGIPKPRKYLATRITLGDLPSPVFERVKAHRHYPKLQAA